MIIHMHWICILQQAGIIINSVYVFTSQIVAVTCALAVQGIMKEYCTGLNKGWL